MGKTLSEKVWDAHVVRSAEGEPDLLYIDLHLVHEVTSPQAFEGLRLAGRQVRRPELTLATEDHEASRHCRPLFVCAILRKLSTTMRAETCLLTLTLDERAARPWRLWISAPSRRPTQSRHLRKPAGVNARCRSPSTSPTSGMSQAPIVLCRCPAAGADTVALTPLLIWTTPASYRIPLLRTMSRRRRCM